MRRGFLAPSLEDTCAGVERHGVCDGALAAADGWAVRAATNPRLRDEGRGPFFAGAELEALLAAQGAARTRVEGWANYEPSRVVVMPAVARALGVARVVAKDESDRFGTGSFKALGGALVVDELRETREREKSAKKKHRRWREFRGVVSFATRSIRAAKRASNVRSRRVPRVRCAKAQRAIASRGTRDAVRAMGRAARDISGFSISPTRA